MLVTLVVLAASAAGGLVEARGYGPVISGVQRFPDIAPGVVATILCWVVLTLAIIAAWVFLLWRPETVFRITGASLTGNRRSRQRQRPSEGITGE